MDENKENLGRFGIATKGFVYVLLGGLTVLAAVGMGGNKSGSGDALGFLAGSVFGKMVLIVTTLGLIAYVFWRFYQTFVDPENKGTGKKGLARRIGYFSSGIIYSFLIITAVEILLGTGSGSSGGRESLLSKVLSERYGQLLVGIVALIYFGKAVYQIYRAYSGSYKKKVKEYKFDRKTQKLIVTFGIAGYTSRGIVIGIIAWLTFRAAITSNSDNGGGTKDAFNFLQNEFGTYVLAVIALGLILYGIFILIKARYREMN